MKEKITQSQNKSGFRIPLGFKIALIAVLMALAARGISAAEILNAKVVEYFEEVVGRTSLAYAGVDTNSDGFADMFLIIEPLESTLYRRLANYVQQTKVVSYDDSRKVYDRELGNYTVSTEYILEVGGKSVLELFPGKRADFPIESARQERLQAQASTRPAAPASPPPPAATSKVTQRCQAPIFAGGIGRYTMTRTGSSYPNFVVSLCDMGTLDMGQLPMNSEHLYF